MKNKRNIMSRLIIDGNSVFEIDEECVKKRKVPAECDIEKYMRDEIKNDKLGQNDRRLTKDNVK